MGAFFPHTSCQLKIKMPWGQPVAPFSILSIPDPAGSFGSGKTYEQ